MKKFEKNLELIDDNNHYFIKSKKYQKEYLKNFKTNVSCLLKKLSKQEKNKLFKHKLQLRNGKFNEKQFIQNACELTISSYFCNKYFDTFEYEEKVNPNNNTDVDLRFKDGSITYNIEVKCSDYNEKEKIDNKNTFKCSSVGRLDDFFETTKQFTKLLDDAQKKKKEIKPPVISKNMDNNLKDFLILSNNKFNPDVDENEVNILAVCCNDVYDLQKWYYNYLFAPRGLFTQNSFEDVNNYRLVDVVLFTNLYFRHFNFTNKKINNNWDLNFSFNIIACNPHRKSEKKNSILNFLNLIPNYNDELFKYKVPGDAPIEVKNPLKINYFVKEYLEKEKNVYLFEEK